MTVYSGVALDYHPRSNSTEIEIEQGGAIVEVAGFYQFGQDVQIREFQILKGENLQKAKKANRPTYWDRI